ncbi:MAG: hypothetical protein DLM54_06510 [Acidimicrobiales bacterium]|nr:MAG: hypothetical protein DLM54_06510 [Acidimicrobiales bacterium]
MEGASFDRAADLYDRTRALPPEASEAVTAVLVEELVGRQPALEVGVGTGRIAHPLRQRGMELVGIDVAPAMLERLAAKSKGRVSLPLVVGDAAQLPLAHCCFGAVLFSHVLHLLPGWKAVVDEAIRVTRPGGVLLVDFGGGAVAPWSEQTDEILRQHGVLHERPGVSDAVDIESHLAGRARLRPLEPVPTGFTRSLAMDIRDWENQIHSWTWSYPAEQLAEACRGVQTWAEVEGLPLNRQVKIEWVIQWWAFDLQPSETPRQ